MATLRMQEGPGVGRCKGEKQVKVGKNLIEAIDEDLITTGPIFDFELWQPANKIHLEIPDDSQGD